MELKVYLKSSKISQRKFSDSLGIHYMHLSKIIRRERRPSANLALRIQEATGGKVPVMELLYPGKQTGKGAEPQM
jgi:plasmid maintenance system antidote protein VapI